MMDISGNLLPGEMKVFLNYIYEYKKGVRNMVLCTLNKDYEDMALDRLRSQNICFMRQAAGERTVNIYFGKPECIEAIRMLVVRPLSQLSPEEDFILGAMLGYDICLQCERFCVRKRRTTKLQ